MFRLVLLILDFFASYPSADGGGGWDPDGSGSQSDQGGSADPLG